MLNKNVIVFFIIITILIATSLIYKTVVRHNHQNKIILAKELNKGLTAMMADLSRGQAASVKGVPADGQWHHKISFETSSSGIIEYHMANHQLNRINKSNARLIASNISALNIRRQSNDVSMVEVQIRAQKGTTLISNFKIRMLD